MSKSLDGIPAFDPIRDFPDTAVARLNRREAIQGAIALATASMLSGCTGSGFGSTQKIFATSHPNAAQPVPTSGSLASASLTVSSAVVGNIGSNFMGLSFDKGAMVASPSLFTSTNTNLVNLFKLLGVTLLRVGGNTVDQNTWTPNGPGATIGQIAPADINALAGFVKAVGCQCLYGVNLGGAGPYPYTSGSIVASTTPTLAAEEVAYASQQLGSSLFGIEIGNEPDYYGSTYFAGTTWEVDTFIALWSTFRSAILAETPSAYITGPAPLDTSGNWAITFGECVTSRDVSLLTQHYYRGNADNPNSTLSFLLSTDTTLLALLGSLYNATSQTIGIPYRISECNAYSFSSNPTPSQGVTDANGFAAALWVLDFLFDCAMNSATGVNIHNGGGAGNGSRPIVESKGTVTGLAPEYYGILLFSLAGQGPLLTISLSGLNGLNVTAYAVQASSGGTNIIINNKDGSNNLQLTVNLPQAVSAATLLQMAQLTTGNSGPDVTATTGVTIQGATVGINGSFSPGPAYTLTLNSSTQLSCYVPYESAVLIHVQ